MKPVTVSTTIGAALLLAACGGGGSSPGVTQPTPLPTPLPTALTVSPGVAALTVSQTQQYTATVPGGGTVTWTVDGVAGGNAGVGVVSSTGLYTAGTATGVHTILASSVADASQTGTATAAVTDLTGVYTYHNNLARDGANTQEYALTTSNVNSGHFGKLTSCTVDGAIYAQPLWVANLTVNGAKRNVVFVATQHDSVYAFDADASPCVQLWYAGLVDASHGGTAGETSVPNSLVGGGSGDIAPEVGVTSTPVIDPASGILYVLAKSVNSAQTAFYQRLHAIDYVTGSEKTGSPVAIAATYPGTGDGTGTVTFDPRQENQRPGLTLLNGTVYIAWAGHADYAPFYGWMMGYSYIGTSFSQTAVLNTAPNTREAGIWMSGGAPAVDYSNNLYVLTGNGNFDANSSSGPTNDYGDSLLQLSSGLNVLQYFTPSDQAADNANNYDFGSGGATLLADLPGGSPVLHLLICGGKGGNFYVLNRDALGGFGDSVAVQKVWSGGSIFGTGAFWNNIFYITGVGGSLSAFPLNSSAAQPMSSSPSAVSSNHFGEGGGTPSISSAATSSGVVWVLDNGNYCTSESPGCGAAVLYAYDATNVATPLWSSALIAGDQAGIAVKFTVPTVANGKVYVGTRGNNTGGAFGSTSAAGELDIYGLEP
ncbi:MAG TPA: hypothetical protein VNR70_03760 [Steroidobacteraceae bacterium]|nr:hypothetical protein [Steroidobacteraceae bacterium]